MEGGETEVALQLPIEVKVYRFCTVPTATSRVAIVNFESDGSTAGKPLGNWLLVLERETSARTTGLTPDAEVVTMSTRPLPNAAFEDVDNVKYGGGLAE